MCICVCVYVCVSPCLCTCVCTHLRTPSTSPECAFASQGHLAFSAVFAGLTEASLGVFFDGAALATFVGETARGAEHALFAVPVGGALRVRFWIGVKDQQFCKFL